jgi:hypothetical protein
MGSLTSSPKISPTVQPVIYNIETPNYAPTPTYPSSGAGGQDGQGASGNDNSTGTGDNNTGSPATPIVSDETKSAARAENLLTRTRGKIGTILTSFRGVLNQTAQTGRKTLLGE